MASWARWSGSLAAAMSLSLWVGLSHAQEPAGGGKTTPAAAPAAPDLVRLKNGGLVRGTISELVPGETVTIVTLTGEARKFPMAEVTYAGAAADEHGTSATPAAATAAPAPTPNTVSQPVSSEPVQPYATVDAQAAHVHLVSEPPGLVFARQAASIRGRSAYARLCATPCDITLPAGTETLSIGPADGAAYKVENVSLPAGKSEVRATYVSRRSTRITGWLVMGAGLAGGTAILFLSDGDSKGAKIAGWLVGLGGLGLGIGLAVVSDKSTIERVPGTAPPSAERHASLVPALQGTF